MKSSCTRFIYTNTIIPAKDRAEKNEKVQAAFDDAADLVEKVLYTFESPIQCSLLKSRMRNLDSAFDEKTLGFTSFTAFLQALDGINVYYDSDIKTWFVSTNEDNNIPPPKAVPATLKPTPSPEIQKPLPHDDIYRTLLRKKQWQSIPKETLLAIYHQCVALGALPKREIAERVLESLDDDTTSADIKKAISLFYKAKLITIEKGEDEEDALWKVNSVTDQELFVAIDKAMIPRLMKACHEKEIPLDINSIKKLSFSYSNGATIKTWIEEAKRATIEE